MCDVEGGEGRAKGRRMQGRGEEGEEGERGKGREGEGKGRKGQKQVKNNGSAMTHQPTVDSYPCTSHGMTHHSPSCFHQPLSELQRSLPEAL